MKRYLIALVMLVCVWAWCGGEHEPVTITDGGMNEYVVINELPPVTFVSVREPYDFEVMRAEMIAALKEAKAELEAERYIITGYDMNGACAKIICYEPLSEYQIKYNEKADEDILSTFRYRRRHIAKVVYPPELVKMIEELGNKPEKKNSTQKTFFECPECGNEHLILETEAIYGGATNYTCGCGWESGKIKVEK